MSDFNFINSRLATGAAILNAEDVLALIQAGVTAVIDCRNEFDDSALLTSDPQISYLWDGTDDDGMAKPTSWFDKGIQFAFSALSRPNTKVYCHCAGGVNRGPSMAYAILRAFGISPEESEAMIRKARSQVGLRYKADADAAIVSLGYG